MVFHALNSVIATYSSYPRPTLPYVKFSMARYGMQLSFQVILGSDVNSYDYSIVWANQKHQLWFILCRNL